MGAWIAPLALAYRAALPRRASSPAPAPATSRTSSTRSSRSTSSRYAEILLDYDMDQRSLDAHDPALTMFQWATEPSDPQVYDRRIVREPRRVAAQRADGAGHRRSLHPAAHRERDQPLARARPRRPEFDADDAEELAGTALGAPAARRAGGAIAAGRGQRPRRRRRPRSSCSTPATTSRTATRSSSRPTRRSTSTAASSRAGRPAPRRCRPTAPPTIPVPDYRIERKTPQTPRPMAMSPSVPW